MKLRTWTASVAALVLSTAPVFAVESTRQWADSLVMPVSCDNNCCDPVDCGDPCCGSGVFGSGGLFSGIGNGAVENFSLGALLGLDSCSWLEVGGFTQMGYHDQIEPISPQPNGPGTACRALRSWSCSRCSC